MTFHIVLLTWLSSNLLLSWGSLYYAFAVLAGSMGRDLGCSSETVAGAFSVALLVWGLATYPAGLAMERWGARRIMGLGALTAACAFLALSGVDSVWGFYAAWSVLGLAMAMTLYEAAFAVVVQSFCSEHRRRIGWLTVVGALASTLFWPLTFHLDNQIGWRETLQLFAFLHLITALSSGFIRPVVPEGQAGDPAGVSALVASNQQPQGAASSAIVMLTGCFTLYGFVTAAIAVMAIGALQARGLAPAMAVALAACIGPAQALGRILDLIYGKRFDVRQLGWITLGLMSASFVALWLAQWAPLLCLLFVVTYGIGLGLLTVLKATTPLALAGPQGYAVRSGLIGSPSLMARAAGPVGAVWLLEAFGNDGPVVLILLLACLLGAWLFVRAWACEATT